MPRPKPEVQVPQSQIVDGMVHLWNGLRQETTIVPLPPLESKPDGTYHGLSKRTPELETWVKAAARKGATNKAIADALGIHIQTLYNWFSQTPKFKYELELEKRKRVTDKAVENIEKSILDGDAQNSKWWLQHVERSAFHTKQEEDKKVEGSSDILIIQPSELDEQPTLSIEEGGVPSDEEAVGSPTAFDGQEDY